MSGFRDELYDDAVMHLEVKLAKDQEDGILDEQAISIIMYERKFELLCSLIYRCNRGARKLKEWVDQSEIIRRITKQLRKGIGQNIVCTGDPGSGKSHSDIRIAMEVVYLTGGKFTVNECVKFTPLEFMQAYNDEKLLPPGSAIILEEAGVSNGRADYQSKGNKMINKIMQIIRHRALLCFWNTPNLQFIENRNLVLMHYWLETKYLDKEAGICYLKWHERHTNQQTGLTIWPFPVVDRDQIDELRVTRLPKHIAQEYEVMAKAFKDKVATDIEKELDEQEVKVDNLYDLEQSMFDKFKEMHISGHNRATIMDATGISTKKFALYRQKYLLEKRKELSEIQKNPESELPKHAESDQIQPDSA
jgi:hypothetical protein